MLATDWRQGCDLARIWVALAHRLNETPFEDAAVHILFSTGQDLTPAVCGSDDNSEFSVLETEFWQNRTETR